MVQSLDEPSPRETETKPPPGLFFTGTDTDVGKTFVTACVAHALRAEGGPVAVCKPVATGAEWDGAAWRSGDTRLLAAAAGESDLAAVTPWAFPDPVAPPVATRRAGVVLTLAEIVGAVRGRLRPDVPLLVEGVGGLLCPLTERETVADLAAALGLPLIVVARRGLGTLNHTLLTLEAARGHGLTVAGVVVNEVAPARGLADETNVDELRRLGVPVLAVVPHQERPVPGALPELAAVARLVGRRESVEE
ncbi:MAG TPA: dethiobiotin synthase [Gemmataceae bacterium]|nr:dethiobiotin synthase [Gemmataceae bacterium]